ncbi:Peptidyl-tRNA hydrolase ICT1, mitochondrial, partial [Trichinella pseudospiralis]
LLLSLFTAADAVRMDFNNKFFYWCIFFLFSGNTRVEVRFHVCTAKWIPQKTRDQFMKDYCHKLTKNGILCIRSERTRSQFLNLADCLDKLRYSIRESEKKLNVKTPDAETLELIKWRQINAARKRIEAKRWRAQLKMTNDDF